MVFQLLNPPKLALWSISFTPVLFLFLSATTSDHQIKRRSSLWWSVNSISCLRTQDMRANQAEICPQTNGLKFFKAWWENSMLVSLSILWLHFTTYFRSKSNTEHVCILTIVSETYEENTHIFSHDRLSHQKKKMLRNSINRLFVSYREMIHVHVVCL